jgi:hypothetical protein
MAGGDRTSKEEQLVTTDENPVSTPSGLPLPNSDLCDSVVPMWNRFGSLHSDG